MDGDGREQKLSVAGSPPDNEDADESGPIRPEGRGKDRFGGGALATDRSDKAVEVQSVATTDDYAGASESGV